jgi:tRNA (guanosine-2'-O-)-methyltransferase
MSQRPSIRERLNKLKRNWCKKLVVVIENPKDIKNIGTIIRNVNAFGASKVYIVDPHRKIPDDWQDIRKKGSLLITSVSAAKWTFIKRFDSTEECLNHLEKRGYISVVTSPHIKGEDNVILHEGDYTFPRLAVWFGNESKGISELAVDRSTFCINIPMYGLIESLNLGTTTGIVLYEVTRQRREYMRTHKKANRRL